jgi:hypothetical protein
MQILQLEMRVSNLLVLKLFAIFSERERTLLALQKGNDSTQRVNLDPSQRGCADPSKTMAHRANIFAPKTIGSATGTRCTSFTGVNRQNK